MPPGKPPRQSTRDLRRAWTDKRAGKWIRRRSLRSFVTDRQAYHLSRFAAPRFMRSFICRFLPERYNQSEDSRLTAKNVPSSYEFSALLAPPIADAQGLWNIFGIAVVLHKWQGVSCC